MGPPLGEVLDALTGAARLVQQPPDGGGIGRYFGGHGFQLFKQGGGSITWWKKRWVELRGSTMSVCFDNAEGGEIKVRRRRQPIY